VEIIYFNTINNTIMNKTIYSLLLASVAIMVTSCADEEYVAPTADRQGLTSLTAIFTSGPFVDQEMAKLIVTDEETDRYVIPVPWYFPETSDKETTPYINKVRIKAEIDNNCTINPPLTLIDLTQENWYTYTNAKGVSRRICITGERVKSAKCEIQAFSLIEPPVSGIVDKSTNVISIISGADLSSCLADVQISAHATISPDPSTTPLDYNDPVELTVKADNGVDKTVYTVIKTRPEKIPLGFNTNSIELIFNFDPVSNLGLPDYTTNIGPTMASINSHLVICTGNGAPIYVNRFSGVKLGEINLGTTQAGSITNDANNNMLIVNTANGGETVNIFRTSSVTQAPTLYYSFTNPTSLPIGAKIKVNGDIDSDALIVLTNYGVSGVTSSSSFTVLTVRGGTVQSVDVKDISSAGLSWGAAPVNGTTVVSSSTNPADGWFESYYGDGSMFNWIKPDLTVGASLSADLTGWGMNPNCLDSKHFNNIDYVALFAVSHFPAWGMGPQLFIYDVNDKSRLPGDNVGVSPALAFQNQNIEWFQTGDYSVASGDVVMAPTPDGYQLYIYYYDHNSGVVGGYVADCIKR